MPNPTVVLPWISRKSSARILGPLSLGFPEPLNTRPEGMRGEEMVQEVR